jgi:hypothetical protein
MDLVDSIPTTFRFPVPFLFFLESCLESGKNTDFANFRPLVPTVVEFPWNDPGYFKDKSHPWIGNYKGNESKLFTNRTIKTPKLQIWCRFSRNLCRQPQVEIETNQKNQYLYPTVSIIMAEKSPMISFYTLLISCATTISQDEK